MSMLHIVLTAGGLAMASLALDPYWLRILFFVVFASIAFIYFFKNPFRLGLKFPESSINYRNEEKSTFLIRPLLKHKEDNALHYPLGKPINLVLGIVCDMPFITFDNVRLDIEFKSGPSLGLIAISPEHGWLANTPNRALTYSFGSYTLNQSTGINAEALTVNIPTAGKYKIAYSISANGLIGGAKSDYFCILMKDPLKPFESVPESYTQIGSVHTVSTPRDR